MLPAATAVFELNIEELARVRPPNVGPGRRPRADHNLGLRLPAMTDDVDKLWDGDPDAEVSRSISNELRVDENVRVVYKDKCLR